MSDTAVHAHAERIEVDEVFPHAPALLWRTLTTPELMGRWLMAPSGFVAEPGARFTYHTTPAGEWDGTIHCEVLEVVPGERLVYSWKGGHSSNHGYGAPLDTVVTFTLEPVAGGTRLRLIHSGFELPRNEYALRGMSGGWQKVVAKIGELSGEPA